MNYFLVQYQFKNFFSLTILIIFGLLFPQCILADPGANFRIEILTLCGNGLKETGEQCDGSDLDGKSCATQGFNSGNLSCNVNCTFNVTACIAGGGGGGGGGGGSSPTVITQVIFSGRAYPLSKVGVLKDGQLVVTTIAGPDAQFNVALNGISSGNYNFSVFGEDNQNRRSSLFTFPIFITQGATTQVSGIFLAPTIAVDKSQVKRGDNIVIFGQSVPDSEVTISVHSAEEFFQKTKADSAGVYLYNFDTSVLAVGQHAAKSKSALRDDISSFSLAADFLVGTQNVSTTVNQKIIKGDLNQDGRVNLVDFSIAAYWYKRSLSDIFRSKEQERLNGDGKVNLVDFSIMAFYWTG